MINMVLGTESITWGTTMTTRVCVPIILMMTFVSAQSLPIASKRYIDLLNGCINGY